MTRPLVTLTTDFGQRDPYVAAMKGVVLSGAPSALVVDLTHEIPPGDLFEASLFIAGSVSYFPEGTVHVVVIDPGVGTDRRAAVFRIGGHTIVAPDNGLITFLLETSRLEWAREITNPAWMRDEVSRTFHGRDIFAPTAAAIASGRDVEECGPLFEDVVTIEVPPLVQMDDGIHMGEVIHIDRFGNIITNFRSGYVGRASRVAMADSSDSSFGIVATYVEIAPGAAAGLVGSGGYLEIAMNGEPASERLSVAQGDRVILRNH